MLPPQKMSADLRPQKMSVDGLTYRIFVSDGSKDIGGYTAVDDEFYDVYFDALNALGDHCKCQADQGKSVEPMIILACDDEGYRQTTQDERRGNNIKQKRLSRAEIELLKIATV